MMCLLCFRMMAAYVVAFMHPCLIILPVSRFVVCVCTALLLCVYALGDIIHFGFICSRPNLNL